MLAVEASSPGAAAGLQPRDVIVSAAQQPINDVATLQSLLAAGPRVELTIVHNQARVLLHWPRQATEANPSKP